MIKNNIALRLDFESLQRTLKLLKVRPAEAAELMEMSPRNFRYLKADASKVKVRNLLALTNKVGLDLRDFLVESHDALQEVS